MPRAAPGDNARWAVRRKLPGYLEEPDHHSGGLLPKCPYRSGIGYYLHRSSYGSLKETTWTQLLSVYGVERGRLGTVASLVGDCRPPPPGNPHRPLHPNGRVNRYPGNPQKPVKESLKTAQFASIMHKIGGITNPVKTHFSFNKRLIPGNLKILNSAEYFKKNRSSYYCTEKKPVLEFGSFPLPPVRVLGSGTPIYSDNKCSSNVGVNYALPIL